MGCGDSKDTYHMDKNSDGVRSGGRGVLQLLAVVWQLNEERIMVQNLHGGDERDCESCTPRFVECADMHEFI